MRLVSFRRGVLARTNLTKWWSVSKITWGLPFDVLDSGTIRVVGVHYQVLVGEIHHLCCSRHSNKPQNHQRSHSSLVQLQCSSYESFCQFPSGRNSSHRVISFNPVLVEVGGLGEVELD